MSDQRLRIDAANVVHEEVDGEVIAIDLNGGSYYSLSGSGPAIWGLLATGASEDEVCASLADRFGLDPETIRQPVADFLERLLESELVAVAESSEAGRRSLAATNGSETFEPPVFERYTDMKDYFLLDPIHEVDATGWPKPAE